MIAITLQAQKQSNVGRFCHCMFQHLRMCMLSTKRLFKSTTLPSGRCLIHVCREQIRKLDIRDPVFTFEQWASKIWSGQIVPSWMLAFYLHIKLETITFPRHVNRVVYVHAEMWYAVTAVCFLCVVTCFFYTQCHTVLEKIGDSCLKLPWDCN